jgi:hypothetical protein
LAAHRPTPLRPVSALLIGAMLQASQLTPPPPSNAGLGARQPDAAPCSSFQTGLRLPLAGLTNNRLGNIGEWQIASQTAWLG